MKTAIYVLLMLVAIPHPIMAQYVYLSPTGGCSIDGIGCMDGFSEFYIFIHTEVVTNAIGTSFYIEGDENSQFGIENILNVQTHEDVVIESGDLFSGITLSWPEGQYIYDTLLTVEFDPDNPPIFSWMVFTRDIELYRASGDTLHLDDFMFYCSHCTGMAEGTIWWQHPDTIKAEIGKQSVIDIPCIGNSSGGLSGTYLDAFDDLGWIDECTHCGVGIDCGPCPWDVQHVLLTISIPSDVEKGTTNKVRLIPSGPCCLDDSTSLYVTALPTIGTEKTSWGTIKKLLNNN
ncbi:MAG: hypothetical protein JSV33_05910 [bacterium]|nr:MAG: hypothetical protein JSV33_05910 [bacterium]